MAKAKAKTVSPEKGASNSAPTRQELKDKKHTESTERKKAKKAAPTNKTPKKKQKDKASGDDKSGQATRKATCSNMAEQSLRTPGKQTAKTADCKELEKRSSIEAEATAAATQIQTWQKLIPEDGQASNITQPLSKKDLSTFLQQAVHLLNLSVSTVQIIIEVLASEGALVRLRQFLKQDFRILNNQELEAMWIAQILPFIQILAHPAVVQSAELEEGQENVVKLLHRQSGSQIAALFAAAVRYLSTHDIGRRQTVLKTSITALASVLTEGTSTRVATALNMAASGLISLVNTNNKQSDLILMQTISGINQRLSPKTKPCEANVPHTASTIKPSAASSTTQKPLISSPFTNPRHDNDHADIRDIKILPTRQEILSTRSEYLPSEDPSKWHLNGMLGFIDRQFRLLRNDSVSRLRDAARSGLTRLKHPSALESEDLLSSNSNAYRNVILDDCIVDARYGLLFVLSFDQPKEMYGKSKDFRQTWWQNSKRFEMEPLVCVVSSAGDATFLQVWTPPADRPPVLLAEKTHDQFNLATDDKRAYVMVKLTEESSTTASAFIKSFATLGAYARHELIEFPGMLWPAFGPSLKALQHLAKTLDVPFGSALLPGGDCQDTGPPEYALQPGFSYDLTGLFKDPTGLTAKELKLAKSARLQDIASVISNSACALDDTQQKAVLHALTKSIALIQGPPGTGKSYTGVKLIKALLGKKKSSKRSPILLVSYTNHATDQAGENALEEGVEHFVRVGSRSKSERLASCNLRDHSKNFDTVEWKKARLQADKACKQSAKRVRRVLTQLADVLQHSEHAIAEYLKIKNPDAYCYLFTSEVQVDGDGFTTVNRHKVLSPVNAWLRGDEKRQNAPNRSPENLRSAPIGDMSRTERLSLLKFWGGEITEPIYRKLEAGLATYASADRAFASIRNERNLRALKTADVVGMTTSGMISRLDLLRTLKPEVAVFEEAGEVLEAHQIAAMLPSLKHAIFIGDHEQLRPKAQNFNLSSENPNCQVAYDISLFERLIRPRLETHAGLPHVTLLTQRRMHPLISELPRSLLYPELQDGPNVQEYSEVAGIRRRLFWLNHENREDQRLEDAHSTSRTNSFEVKMTSALVKHLSLQGKYDLRDIAVLTPYSGQLTKLKQKLEALGIETRINGLEKQNLIRDATSESESKDSECAQSSEADNAALPDSVRVATVDDFQGEQAKVVIISLVRCNDDRKCGFLKTSNRINVLLSRAQHGMYIIGNTATAAHKVKMWQKVQEMLDDKGNLGDQLELCCPRHPDKILEVNKPEDFAEVSPEGGCELLCAKKLPGCDHICPGYCHSDHVHNNVYCREECARSKCSHPCKLPCGQPCKERCEEAVACDLELPCGHHVSELPCWASKDPTKYKCFKRMEKVVPGCGHTVLEACDVAVTEPSYQCPQICTERLSCQHNCQKKCFQCQPKDEAGNLGEVNHGECQNKCGKDFPDCQHLCLSKCHMGEECQPCAAPCSASCAHSSCPNKCSEPCVPCSEEVCTSNSPHSECSMPCAFPCDWVPPSSRCREKLGCGHQCPSMAGEPCPDSVYCQACGLSEVLDTVVVSETSTTYRDVDLDSIPCIVLPCGHVFAIRTLDEHLGMSTHYEMDDSTEARKPVSVKEVSTPFSVEKPPICPKCRWSLSNVARYGRIVRRFLLDESVKKLVLQHYPKYLLLAEELKQQHESLLGSTEDGKILGDIDLTSTTHLTGLLKFATGNRYDNITKLRRTIKEYHFSVASAELPFQKLRETAETRGMEETMLRTHCEFSARILLVRCDLVMIHDLFSVFEKMPVKERETLSVCIEFAGRRKECEELLKKAVNESYVLFETEAHMLWAHFAAVETLFGQGFKTLRREAKSHIREAKKLCKNYPSITANVKHEVEAIHKMLNDLKISGTDMRMNVGTMGQELGNTGRWHCCENGHPFTIGKVRWAKQDGDLSTLWRCYWRRGSSDCRLSECCSRYTTAVRGWT